MVSLVFVGCVWSVQAQTYSVGPGAPQQPQNTSPQSNQQLGFGSNIENARLTRAAELALQRGDHAQAVDYAQRAANAAPNEPALWFLLGYAARLDSKTQLAVEAYNKGLRLKPGAVEGISGLAQTYAVMGHNADAERLLKQVVAADPKRVDDAVLLGDIYMRGGDYNSALGPLSRAEQIQPNVRSELLLAMSYQHLKQMDQANRYLDMAKHRAPDNPEVQRALAGYYRETGNYAEAIAALKSIKNPRPDVKAELAYTYQLDGKLEESARLYTQAANAEPKDLGLQLSAAQAELGVNSIAHANAFLRRAAAIDPNYYRLHAIRGQIARLNEHDAEAIKEYNEALAHLPENPAEGPLYGIQMHMDLMELYRSVKDDAAAQAQLQTAKTQIAALDEQGASRAPFLRLRALIKMNSGDLDGALGDMKQALALNESDPNSLQLDGDLLMKMGRSEDAIAVYKRIIATDPSNRYALTSLGYASREAGHDQDAEKYFHRLAEAYPALYVPYLALGDMYTSRRDFARAEASYSKAYALAPDNALIVAGGLNAAIESHKLTDGAVWMSRAKPEMREEPTILREEERYLSFKGDYQESADLGRQAIKVLPKDRDVVVYLGYDLLHLEQYDELQKLTAQYMDTFPKDPDIPLLAGYVDKHNGNREVAIQDFTTALTRDPKVVTAYVNRGYLLNDLHKPAPAAEDFEAALKLEPKNGEAHLGLAYSSLDMHKPQVALRQVQLAQQEMGDSEPIHLILATAYGQKGMLIKSAAEYRIALKFSPNDGSLHLALAGILYSARQYHQSITELETTEKLIPENPLVYALMARNYAQLQDRVQTLHYVDLAEQRAQQMPAPRPGEKSELSEIYVSTGQALSLLGDQKLAMQHFAKALESPGADRVTVRLAIAQLMAQEDHPEDARRQVALALMEAEAGDTLPPTGEQLIEAADIFRSVHEYELSEEYLRRARAAGASETAVRIGLANTYLALGDTARAHGELSAISTGADSEPDYQYLLAEANVYRQEHQSTQALTAFAQASNAAGEDQAAQQDLLQAGADEGLRVTPHISLLSDFSVDPIFEDSTVYVLDSKLDASFAVPPSDTSLLPPPRSSTQIQETAAFHLHLGNMPTASGFFQVRNARGLISVPSTNSIQDRDTTDYTMNFGLNPTVHLGSNVLTFDSGIQGTIRRDANDPTDLNQNLFRVFTYVQSSSFFNAVSFSGYVIHESGPFSESNQHSSALIGAIDFRVGEPWGKNTLVTGWGSADQNFTPVKFENYYTSSYIGMEHRFSDKLNLRAVIEDLRAWRVVGTNSGIAQAVRPAGTVQFTPTHNWSLQAQAAYTRTQGFHVYDNIQSGFSASYAMPFHHGYKDRNGEVGLQYPIRFAAGVQQDTFYNFSAGHSEQFRPYVSISLF